MPAPIALHQAMDLLHQPILARAMRDQPLPGGVLVLLRIVAGDGDALEAAGSVVAETPERIREAAALYVQQVLLCSRSDSYRVLGVNSDAPQEEIREHLGWLVRWLHPDRAANAWDSVFARRVLAAWDCLKTNERRARYDETHGISPERAMRPRQRIPRRAFPSRQIPRIAAGSMPMRGNWLRRLAALALSGWPATDAKK